jgi:WD40 repeat protein
MDVVIADGVRRIMRCCFSPDDSFLAMCGALEEDGILGVIRVFDIAAGCCTASYATLPSDCYTSWISNSDVIIGRGSFDANSSQFTLYRGDARGNHSLQPIGCISLPGVGFIRQLTAIFNEETIWLYYTSDGELLAPYQICCVQLPSRSKTINSKESGLPSTLIPIMSADLNAHIVGLNFSSDQMFLLVNCRVSASGDLTEQLKLREEKSPVLSDKMEIRVMKTSNLQVIHTIRGHVAWSQEVCYYIMLDSSKQFIARQVMNIVI